MTPELETFCILLRHYQTAAFNAGFYVTTDPVLAKEWAKILNEVQNEIVEYAATHDLKLGK